jgi:hypothetical protein
MTAVSALEAGAHRLVFGAGQLSTGAALASQVNGLTISTTVDSFGSGVSSGIFIHSIVFENADDLYAHKRTSGSVNVTFYLQSLLPPSGRIIVHLPDRFFVGSFQPLAVLLCSGVAPVVVCELSAAAITCTTSSRSLGAGLVTLQFLPGTLTTGVSRNGTNDSFKIETSEDAASVAAVTPHISAGRVRVLPQLQHTYFNPMQPAFLTHLAFCCFV